MEKKQINIEEIDLTELILFFWRGKWIIILCLLFSSFYSFYLYANFERKSDFESRIYYEINNPPFFDTHKTTSYFIKKFYSEEIFENWKLNNSISINFSEFSRTFVREGVVLKRNYNALLAKVVPSGNEFGSYLIVKTNNLGIINDFYNYLNHVGEIINKDFLELAIIEKNNLQKNIQELSNVNLSNLKLGYFEISRYIFKLENTDTLDVIKTERPSFPIDKSKNISTTKLIFPFITGLIVALFILISKKIYLRIKKKL